MNGKKLAWYTLFERVARDIACEGTNPVNLVVRANGLRFVDQRAYPLAESQDN